MTINIENEYGNIDIPNVNQVIENVIEEALDFVKCPYECEVNVLLTGNDRIQEINKTQRNIDSPTDVLSFPMIFYETPGVFDDEALEAADCFNPETGELILGDIIISIDRVYEQAESYNHSKTRELAFLTAHSMLHLSGYDHIDDDERLVMEELQEQILRLRGYTRNYEED